MNMKKILIMIALVIGVWFVTKPSSETIFEEEILFTTYGVSKEYTVLRYRTDKVLTEAKKYKNHSSWNSEVSSIINDWDNFIKDADRLEKDALVLTEAKIVFEFIQNVYAYDRQEISQVFDRAPTGKKIATLAKHLGVDAKKAMKILQQDQAQVTADAWNEAGDTFQKLETSATVIKDTAKVTVFVGTVVATGGAAGFAAGSAVTKASIVVSGADLILEVSDDAAKVGLGNHNKISAITSQVRAVTEPLAGLLSVADIPKNVTKGIEKLSAVNFGAEQLNSTIQDGKIIGIELPVAKKVERFQNIKKYKAPVYVSSLKKEEVSVWIKEQIKDSEFKENEDTIRDVLEIEKDSSGFNEVDQNKEDNIEQENIDPAIGPLFISSPKGVRFTPEEGLFFKAELRNPESFIAEGKKMLSVWCHWKFYFDDKLYSEKINPSTIHAGTKDICGYSTTLIKEQKGKLKVELNLERSTRSKYSDEPEINILIKTERIYDLL